MSALNIAHLRELLEKATARPWQIEDGDVRGGPLSRFHDGSCCDHTGPGCYTERRLIHEGDDADAQLLLAAVNALPALLEIAEAAVKWRARFATADVPREVPLMHAVDSALAAVDRSRTP